MLKKIIRYIKEPKYLIFSLLDKGFFDFLSDKKFSLLEFYFTFNKRLNLEHPKTFNEKLQWLKLNDRKPEYTKMVDKYEVKEYIKEKIGEEFIIPTLGIYDNFDDIDFDKLPNQFVIKCTHDSGGIVICKDKTKINILKLRKKFNKCLKRKYYYLHREWPYKNVKPRIIIEKYMSNENGNDLKDYKFFCFNGKVKAFKIDFDRYINHRANYYDLNCNLLPFGEIICPPDFNKKLKIPQNINKMIKFAEILSKDICFLRVDFYEISGQLFFGELTFYPAAGFGKFEPEEYDKILGDMLKLPIDNKEDNNEK